MSTYICLHKIHICSSLLKLHRGYLMKSVYSFLVIAAIAITGCSSAQKSSEVQAIRVPIAPYLKMDCQELATEQSFVLREADAVRSQVDQEYSSDKNTELVTWVLFAPAAFFLDGNAESASKLASLKGQLETIQEAQKVNNCTR